MFIKPPSFCLLLRYGKGITQERNLSWFIDSEDIMYVSRN
jgi:hypothetical protein